jgi:hypothetical protein
VQCIVARGWAAALWGDSARTGQAVAPRQHGIPSVCKAMALHSRGRDVCLPPVHACSCASLHPSCHRCAIAPSYAAKLVLVQGELQRRRSASNVFAGRHGFITPRDLFRCGCGSWQGLFSSLALGARENSLLLLTAGRCGVWRTCVTCRLVSVCSCLVGWPQVGGARRCRLPAACRGRLCRAGRAAAQRRGAGRG